MELEKDDSFKEFEMSEIYKLIYTIPSKNSLWSYIHVYILILV